MKILKKCLNSKGRHVYVYLFGIKIASYTPKQIIVGKDNAIDIPDNIDFKCRIFGDNNKVKIAPTKFDQKVLVDIGFKQLPCNNCKISIGADTYIGNIQCETPILENGMSIEIGNDCLFSIGIKLYPSDVHTVLNKNDKVTNIGKCIKIGNHVWIGENVSILKNTEIADGCIIGVGSVVSGKFLETNCVIAGNPARVVKHNIKWDRRYPKQLLI